jgi:predicted DsbA family dithiol-disulfide isomerase
LNIQWVYFPLHPDTPAEGLALKDLFAGRGLDLNAMHARMKRMMEVEGLPYAERSHTYNSRLAQELAKWADAHAGFESVHDKLYRAYFEHGRNIGDPAVLVEIAESIGMPADARQEVLFRRAYRQAVDDDWEYARRAGVTGVPTFIAGHYKVVGAQPYDVLERLLEAARGETGS